MQVQNAVAAALGIIEKTGSGILTSASSAAAGTGTVIPTASLPGTLARDGVATPHQLALVVNNLQGLSQSATASVRIRTSLPQGAYSAPIRLFRVQPANVDIPPWGALEDVFAWTIFGLQPDTAYDVELTLQSGASIDVRAPQTFSTKALPTETLPPVTTLIGAGSTASQVQTAVNGAFAAAGGSQIHIQFQEGGTNSFSLAGVTWPSNISGASEAAPTFITGGSRAVELQVTSQNPIINLANNLSNVVIQDLSGRGSEVLASSTDTSTWVYSPGSASATNITIRRTTCVGVNRGIYFRGEVNQTADQHGILAYDNTITGNLTWNETDIRSSISWDLYGFLVAGDGICCFRNTISRFGDMFSCTSGATSSRSEQDRSQHFYWNDVNIVLDDVFEVDDGHRNITCIDNRFRNVVNAGSSDPLYGGPYICARNLFINVLETRMFKWNDDSSGLFIYNNTFAMTDKIYRSSPGQDNLSLWYQPSGATISDFAIANNLFVMLNGPPTDRTLWIDNNWGGGTDIHHNGWYPDGNFSSDFSGVQSSLAAHQAVQPAANGVFENLQRFENDIILSSAQAWVTTITLGANALTEVTADYDFGDFALNPASNANNAGIEIPGITNTLDESYNGAAPDMGCNIDGLTAPTVGDQSSLPSWWPAVGVSVQIPQSNTARAVAEADGAVPGYGGTDRDHADIFDPWSGGGLVDVAGQKRILVYGGGHGDSSYNGILGFGPLTGVGSDLPAWVLHLAGSASAAVRGQPTYTDGRQASHHSYDNMDGVGERLYVLSTSEHVYSAASSSDAYYFTQAGQVAIQDGPFGGGGNTRLTTAYSAQDNRIYVLPCASTADVLRYFDLLTGQWGFISGTSRNLSLYSVMAIDTNRNRLLYLRANGSNEGIYYDPDTGASQAGKNFPSNYFSNLTFDPDRDVFMHVRNNSLTVDELDASALSTSGGNPSWVTRIFTGDIPSSADGSNGKGPYGRVRYVPALKGITYAPGVDSPVFFLRTS